MNHTPEPRNEAPSQAQSPRDEYQRVKSHLLSLVHEHAFYSPESSPHKPHLPQQQQDRLQEKERRSPREFPTIASLSIHPSLETALHILNADLTAAHFLLRHAQSSPQWEMMYLHGILHRIEGDVDNARAWYGDVAAGKADVLPFVWGEDVFDTTGEDEAAAENVKKKNWQGFLDRMQRWRDSVRKRDGSKVSTAIETAGSEGVDGHRVDWDEEERQLRELSLSEIRKVLEFCEEKYGLEVWRDVSQSVWISSDQEDEKIQKIKQSMLVGGEGWREF